RPTANRSSRSRSPPSATVSTWIRWRAFLSRSSADSSTNNSSQTHQLGVGRPAEVEHVCFFDEAVFDREIHRLRTDDVRHAGTRETRYDALLVGWLAVVELLGDFEGHTLVLEGLAEYVLVA